MLLSELSRKNSNERLYKGSVELGQKQSYVEKTILFYVDQIKYEQFKDPSKFHKYENLLNCFK